MTTMEEFTEKLDFCLRCCISSNYCGIAITRANQDALHFLSSFNIHRLSNFGINLNHMIIMNVICDVVFFCI